MKQILIAFVFCGLCYGCNNDTDPAWSELPDVTEITTLKLTEFVPTLESPVTPGKNFLYAPTMLFAWDEVKTVTGAITLPASASDDLRKLNTSSTHLGSLNENEYNVSARVLDDAIYVHSYFNKTLPFAYKLHKTSEPLKFLGQRVSAFGMEHYDRDVDAVADLLYYEDDDHFVLLLSPKDTSHQIFLAKGIGEVKTLAEAVKKTGSWIEEGNADTTNESRYWRYTLSPDDVIAIPVFRFNVSKRYSTLNGQTFSDPKRKRTIMETFQRIGFILNEEGAVVESEVTVTTDSAGAMEDMPRPKKLVFDKSFYLIIKHTSKANPYFVMKVENAELMMKE